MPQNVLIDSCFWFALFNSSDQYNKIAEDIYNVIEKHKLLIPWPTLYETLNTKFVKNSNHFDPMQRILSQNNIVKLDDTQYKSNALNTLDKYIKMNKHYSLVDLVIRFMLEDINLRVEALVTFNLRDFQDLCYARSIQLIDS